MGFALSPNGWCERFDFVPPVGKPRPSIFDTLPPAPLTPIKATSWVRPNLPQSKETSSEKFPTPSAYLTTPAPRILPPTPPKITSPISPIKPVARPTNTITPKKVITAPSIQPITPVVKLPPMVSPMVPIAPIPSPPPLPTETTHKSIEETTTAKPNPNGALLSGPKLVHPRAKNVGAGEPCKRYDTCIGGSKCVAGICKCPPRSVPHEGKCVSEGAGRRNSNSAHAGEDCSGDKICVGGSICDNDTRKCICAAKHHIFNGICKSDESAPYVAPGSSCQSGEICSGGSICENGMCTCEVDHYEQDGYCRHIASQGSPVQYYPGGALRFSSKASPRPLSTICDPSRCRLPDCFCSRTGREGPSVVPLHETPQFVVLTFDDAVNGRTLPDYKHLFEEPRWRNPNGCPVKGTFFISHEWTNYDSVQWIFQKGMELASNSISHVSLAEENSSRWLNEMDGQRRIIAKFANGNEEEILGMRAPQLALGANRQFEMMSRAGFLYDNSASANPGVGGEPYWPQTLDYKLAWNCHEEGCPESSFPGIWEVPLNQFYGSYLPQIDSYRRSSMIRAAVDLNSTVDQLTSMLMTNFDRGYSTNKAPFVLSLNADFLQLNGKNTGMQALERFMDEILQNKDVFVVTMRQLVEWMRHPIPLNQMQNWDLLRCPRSFSQYPNGLRSSCSKPNKCMYRTPGLNSHEHQFLTCSPCPDLYPWIDNPIGYE